MGAMTRQTLREGCGPVLDRIRRIVAEAPDGDQALHDIARVLADAGYAAPPAPSAGTYQKPLG